MKPKLSKIIALILLILSAITLIAAVVLFILYSSTKNEVLMKYTNICLIVSSMSGLLGSLIRLIKRV